MIKIVKVDQLEVGGEMEDNMMIFIGKMFTIKEQLKVLFNIKYDEIVFQGQNKTAWHAKITENTARTPPPASWRGSQASAGRSRS